MNFLNSLRVSTRLTIGFSVVIASLILVSVLSILRLNEVSNELRDLIDNRNHKIALFNELKDNVQSIARIARNVVLIIDVKDAQAQWDRIPPLRMRNTEILEELRRTCKLPESVVQLRIIDDVRGPYNETLDRALKLGITGNQDDAQKATAILMVEASPLQKKYFDAIDASAEVQRQKSEGVGRDVTHLVESTRAMIVGVTVTAIALGALLAWVIARGIINALGAEPTELSQAVAHMADGDLTQRLQLLAGDKHSIMAAVHRMQAGLNRIVHQVREGSCNVATASVQIAQGNSDLSSRTEEQASALEETAASMEQLGSTVRQNADSARQANQLAQSAAAVAKQGGDVMDQVVETMKGIDASSHRIADIISVIDGIAFQTNILALNAAVEAARAGEQGRGFAVVASEVRTLAQRSAEAAKEIKTLIADSVERVEAGSNLVDRAGATMREVVNSIRRVTDIVGEISAASTEQSAGVAQVGEAVTQMDQATQQNAALVEQSAAAAESLKAQAQALVNTVEVFRVASQRYALQTH